ncbi:MAG: hypothetical protein KAH32_04730 [Chlamydiia bacterium]|nr:hypothetical protein [Chlamydiia bacterium]
MNIRGNLNVLRDLVVKTAASDPEIGKLLYAGSSNGEVTWSNLKVYNPTNALYGKGSLVFSSDGKKLYIANTDDAPGLDLDNIRWTEISGGSGSGSDNVVTFFDKPLMEATIGSSNTIYITEDTNSLYRWEGNFYVPIVGIQNAVTASITVGGIKKNDVVNIGSTLQDFIQQLINPYIEPKLSSIIMVDSAGDDDGGDIEVGRSKVIPNAKLSWVNTVTDNKLPTFMTITGVGFSAFTQPTSGTSITIPSSGAFMQKNTTATESWIYNAKNTKGNDLLHRTDTIHWKRRIYWGNGDGTLTSLSILSLGHTTLKTGIAGSYAMDVEEGKYKWWCVEESEAQPNTIKDDSTNFGVVMNNEGVPITVTVDNGFGINYIMKCYRTKDTLGGTLNVTIT